MRFTPARNESVVAGGFGRGDESRADRGVQPPRLRARAPQRGHAAHPHLRGRPALACATTSKADTSRHQRRAALGGQVQGQRGPRRFVRLQIPSPQPIFFHLDEVEVYGPGPDAKNLALHRPADQSSLSIWSTAKPLGRRPTARVYPPPSLSSADAGRRPTCRQPAWTVSPC